MILNIATRKTLAWVAQSHKCIALIYTLLGANLCITSEKRTCLLKLQLLFVSLKHPKYETKGTGM